MFVGNACATTTPQPESPAQAEAPPAEPASQSDVAPRLVVLIVLDQFASWVFKQQLPLLPAGSVIRRAYEEGAMTYLPFLKYSVEAQSRASMTSEPGV